MGDQNFGGQYTSTKLDAVEKYLKAYMTIMRRNETARHFHVTYIDGFAGSGLNRAPEFDGDRLFDESEFENLSDLYRGSVDRALGLERPFDKYIFVEKKRQYAEQLERRIEEKFPNVQNAVVVCEDANQSIQRFCAEMSKFDRALIFLDPYGMQVKWSTLNSIAETSKVDLWLLVPIGQAIARLLTKGEPPPGWATALTKFFGEEGWKSEFWISDQVTTLFGDEDRISRVANYDRIKNYMVSRLRTIFPVVLDQPIVLRNQTGIPLYVLCFASANSRAEEPALRIASSIAQKINDGH